MIAGLCERALSRKPDRAASARILDLKGQAQAKAEGTLGLATMSQRRACRLALSEVARSRLRRASARQASRLEALENQASQCLLNLAWTSWTADVPAGARNGRRDRRAFRTTYGIARLAVRLSDVDAVAHQRLAQLAADTGRLDIAARELSAAARIAPADPLYAAQLALVLAKKGDLGGAAQACVRAERLIDFGDPGQEKAQDRLIEAYRARGEPSDVAWATALETRRTLADEIRRCARQTHAASLAAFEELLVSFGDTRDWEAARLRAHIGRVIRDGPGARDQRSRDAEPYFRDALEWFEKHQPDDYQLAELHSDRAKALALRTACSGEALSEAEAAMILNPLSPAFRDDLARVYEVGGDLNSACTAAEQALLLEPDDPALHHRLAMLRWKLAESLADADAHDAERERASVQFKEALTLYDSDQRDERRTTSWWLAMSYFAMSRFEEVPAHLRFVLASLASGDEATPEERGLQAAAELWLSKTYRKLGKFLDAEAHAHEAVRAAQQLDAEDVALTCGLADEVDDDRWPLWAVLALAHMQVAGCHADRDGRLDAAAASLDCAQAVFERVDARPEGDQRDTDIYADLQAERGRVLLSQDEADDAIKALRSSVDIDPDEADVYLLLARAYARAAEQQIEADWQAHIRHGRAACRRTRDIGGERHPDTIQAKEIEKRLDRVEAAASERSAAAAGNGRPARVSS
jgi:tetratricopeptide (TPR) repeat protein